MASKMAPSTSLLSLPPEIFLHIASFLPAADQASLCATSKTANDFIEPLLWKNIELHDDDGFHDTSAELKDPPPFTAPSSRRYLPDKSIPDGNMSRRIAFFYMLESMYKTDRTRFQHLTARIRSLCTVIDYTQPIALRMRFGYRAYLEDNNLGNDDLMWNLFPHMVNLEVLELHAEWPGPKYKPTPFDGNLPILSRLRFAKLFGYIPRDFARYVILGSAPTLERLELGLLDRPISQDWREDWRDDDYEGNRPLPSERVDRKMSAGHRPDQSVGADGEVEDGGDFDRVNEEDGDHSSNADSDGNSDDGSSDYGSLNGEDHLAPRPLAVFIRNSNSSASGSSRQMSVSFGKLKHLYLCKPVEAVEMDFFPEEVVYSSRARMACAYDWALILCGAKETLETLVLEHRTCVPFFDPDLPSASIVKQGSNGWDESYFVNTIVPILLTEHGGFERLRRISLHGILVGYTSSLKERDGLVALCQQRNIKCEGHLGTVCEFTRYDGSSWAFNQAYGRECTDDRPENFLKRSEIIWRA